MADCATHSRLLELPREVLALIYGGLGSDLWTLRSVGKGCRDAAMALTVKTMLMVTGDVRELRFLERLPAAHSLTIWTQDPPNPSGAFPPPPVSDADLDLTPLAQLLASRSCKLRSLHISGHRAYTWGMDWHRMHALQCLDLNGAPSGMDLSAEGFASLTALRELHLSDEVVPFHAICGRSSLTKLELTLTRSSVTHVHAMASLTALHHLILHDRRALYPQVAMLDLSTLAALTGLTELHLIRVKGVASLECLTALGSLRRLSCIHMGESLDTCPVFTANTRLVYLNLRMFQSHELDVRSLTCLTGLASLHLDYTFVAGAPVDITPLTSLTSLEVLNLSNNPLSMSGVRAVHKACAKLRYLDLTNCGNATPFSKGRGWGNSVETAIVIDG